MPITKSDRNRTILLANLQSNRNAAEAIVNLFEEHREDILRALPPSEELLATPTSQLEYRSPGRAEQEWLKHVRPDWESLCKNFPTVRQLLTLDPDEYVRYGKNAYSIGKSILEQYGLWPGMDLPGTE